jgi:hypothetical protein
MRVTDSGLKHYERFNETRDKRIINLSSFPVIQEMSKAARGNVISIPSSRKKNLSRVNSAAAWKHTADIPLNVYSLHDYQRN